MKQQKWQCVLNLVTQNILRATLHNKQSPSFLEKIILDELQTPLHDES